MKPPGLAAALLRLCAPVRDLAFIEQDLAEEFVRRAQADGRAAAARWYRRQVLGSISPLIGQRLRTARPALPRPAGLGTDAAQALRVVLRHPGTTATVIGTLVIGLTTTLAAALLVHHVILRPLPYETPERLVLVRPAGPRLPASVRSISLPDLHDWQQPTPGLDVLSGYSSLTFTLTDRGEARRVDGLRVGEGFADVLRTPPVVGRAFDARDYAPGAARVVLLGHAMWRRDFGSDPSAVGQTLTLDGHRHEIVGVLPDAPFGDITEPHEFWVPLMARPGVAWEPVRGNGFITVLARVAAGTSLSAAEQQLSARAQALAGQYPRSNADKPAVSMLPLQEAITGTARRPLLLLLLAVGAVLIVACGNLVNLLLAAGEHRRGEYAVRMALGAGLARLRRQVSFETAGCVGLATILALIGAPPLARLFVNLYPAPLPSTSALGTDPALASAAAALGLLIAALLMWPQLRGIGAIRGSATVRITGDRRDRRGRATLIAVQVAFTVVLAFAGVALVRSMARLSALEPGFDPDGVVSLSVTPSGARYPSAVATRAFFDGLLEQVRTLPGVRAAAVSTAIPFVNQGWGFSITPPEGGTPRMVRVTIASPGFFETLGVRVVRGRPLTEAEHRGEARVVVLNELTARLLPYEDPVGRTLRYSGIEWTIVGVVAPVAQVGLRTPATAELFLPWSQAGRAPQRLVADLDGELAAVLPLITARVRALDPSAPVADVVLLRDRIARSVAADRFATRLLTSLAAIGVLLAALGTWSVTAYVVARGTRENGIRAALGESRGRQLRRIMNGTLHPALAGIVAGLVISTWLAPTLAAYLFEIPPRDPLTGLLAATAVLLVIAASAMLPAHRGLRHDPASALRAD
jgi:putative ABC transport system permease protein